MFSFFSKKDPLAELREQAKTLSHHAHKVWCYRRDVIAGEDAETLHAAEKELARVAGDKNPGEVEFKNALEKLDDILRRVGGSIYPSRFIPEWVELIVVAAIIAGGVRSFFLQPFKIPTNSMYPTYHGMTARVYPLEQDAPAGLERAFLKITQWATHVEARTPVAGEVLIPLNCFGGSPAKLEPDSGILGTGILKGTNWVFNVMVGDRFIPISVPQDFSLTRVMLETYFPETKKLNLSDKALTSHVYEEALKRGDITRLPNGQDMLRTHRVAKAGERVVNFDILTGDMVLVDRVSYNFVRPSVGDPFVFATKNIPGLNDPYTGKSTDLYYIKRLVGAPGDTLQVKDPVLFRNGEKITGSLAFEKNNARKTDEEYYGYLWKSGDKTTPYSLREPLTLPEHDYFAMGDNSSNSHDSRGWGCVPEKEIVGRALFILYPFTNRWGIAE